MAGGAAPALTPLQVQATAFEGNLLFGSSFERGARTVRNNTHALRAYCVLEGNYNHVAGRARFDLEISPPTLLVIMTSGASSSIL